MEDPVAERGALFFGTPEEERVIEQGTGERMIRLELKYCERCGGLLLRRTGEAVVYCGSCAKSVNELPVMKPLGARKRDPKLVRTGEARKNPTKSLPATRMGRMWGTVAEGEMPSKKQPQSVGDAALGSAPFQREGWGIPRVGERRLG
jgi:hypothetical protein